MSIQPNEMIRLTGAFFLIGTICSCGAIRNTPKYEFANGYYSTKVFSNKQSKVYVHNEEDFVSIYPLKKIGKTLAIDTSEHSKLVLPQHYSDTVQKRYFFHHKSFDVDFLTIPFKYRPRANRFPRQFNANLNGGVYLGYRNDSYVVKYAKDPFGKYGRRTTHFGFSVGGFTGLGGTAMNPWVTNDQIQIEYDGVVWTKGIASIIGLDQVTLGLSVGWDHLLDKNKGFWLYQGKPWIGLVFGLNLN